MSQFTGVEGRLAIVEHMVEAQMKDKLETLYVHCRRMREEMNDAMIRIDAALERKPGDYLGINSLGLIQDEGLEIDRLCAEIRLIGEFYKKIQGCKEE